MARIIEKRNKEKENGRKRAAYLSTNSKGFVPKSEYAPVRENLYDQTDDDIRLERFNRDGIKGSQKEELISRDPSRGRKIMDILEESPGGYEICAKAPICPENDPAEAIKYYSALLKQFTLELPEEYGIIQFSLGQYGFA
jgi:hypothetical protein